MMQAATMEQAGAEGVLVALSDAMKAGEYARRLKAATAENDALRNKLEAEKAENRRLNNENRAHRFSKSRAYANGIEMQIAGVNMHSYRRLQNWVVFLGGVVAGLAISTVIILIYGLAR